ncbi:T9SS type A sorting domain-containing protein [Polluticoccus soli]|uniref:T9SS type A sorting domain-containing protein n=1 Tax=Polluticoccus soli TaxID=3034150 RepID=UPI0023E2C364|nr:T9SS type A sorting domain-containing protein [Flavipsychrobacter sp. JY13-12]
MKRILLSVLVATSFSVSAQTNYPGGISGCIARWDFATGGGPISALTDVSGNGNNSSSVNNLTSATGFRGVANKAMAFNGFNSLATIPHASLLQPTAITMVSMVRFNGFYTGQCQGNYIISKGDNLTSGNYALVVSDNIYDNSCTVNSPFNKQFYALYGATNLTNLVPAGNYLTTGQWYLFVSSYDGTTLKHYQVVMDPNNYVSTITPFFTTNVSSTIGTNTQNLLIGGHSVPGHPYPVYGSMEEVALFNRVLTNAEVQSVYDYLWGIVAVSSVPTNICTDQPFNVGYTVNNTSFFSASNVFTVQLSNASGSFASPTNIGSVTATSGGTISCMVPSSVPSGTGYRIRIVGTNVSYTGRDNGTNLTVTSLAKPSAGSNTPVCAGQTLNLSGSSSTPGVTYNWSGPLSFSSNQPNPSIPGTTTAHAGNYTLYTTLNGCTSLVDTEAVAIGSNTPPNVVSYASPGDTICVGGTAAFYALVTAGANPQYQWMKNGSPMAGETSATFVSKTLSTGDVINCVVTTTGCSSTLTATSNSHSVVIVGKTPASVSISANPGLQVSPWQTVTFTANVINGGLTPIYQWKLNGNDILGATGQTWSTNNLVNNDAVSVVVRSSSDCAEPATATSQASIVNINTSVGEIDKGNNISIYPNPNNGAFTVTFNEVPSADGQIEVLNAVGQIVHRQQYRARSSSVVVDMSQVAQGVYLMKTDVDGKNYRSRIVISK